MKHLLLVDVDNKNINRALQLLYIKEDFSNLLKNYLSMINVASNDINMSHIGSEVIRILYLILVDNVYRYLATNNVGLFINLISNRLIRNDIFVKAFYSGIFIDFLRINYHVNEIFDKTDLCFETKKFLENAISLILEDNATYEGLIDILNSLMQNVTIYDESVVISNLQDKVLLLVKDAKSNIFL